MTDTPLPCDTEPAYVSYFLTLPPRTFAEAVRDVSRVRDLDPWVFDLLRETRRPSAEIVCMAHAMAARAARARRAGGRL